MTYEQNTGSQNKNAGRDCSEIQELIPAFALGATDPEEEEAIKASLAECLDAARELAEYTALTEALLYAAPAQEAPAPLEARLRRALAEESSTKQAPSPRPPWLSRWLSRWARPAARWSPAAAGLLLVLLAATNVYWQGRVTRLETAQALLLEQISAQDGLIAQITDGKALQVVLPAANEAGSAHATVLLVPDGRQAVLYAEGFPPLPADKVYQLWLIADGERTSGGMFRVNRDGVGMLLVDAPQRILAYDAMGVTPEPSGGSPGPTAPPVVFGAF